MKLTAELMRASLARVDASTEFPPEWQLSVVDYLNALGVSRSSAVLVRANLRRKQLKHSHGLGALVARASGDTGAAACVALDLSLNELREAGDLDALGSALVSLDLSINLLARLSGLAALRSLRVLSLANNKLERIEGFDTLAALRVLDLSANAIEVIEGLDALTALSTLRLDGNAIVRVERIDTLTSLRTLSVSSNRLVDATAVAMVPSLTSLSLAGNELCDVDALASSLRALAALTELDCSGNPMEGRRFYHTRLLEAPALRVLDAFPVSPLFREQAARRDRDAEVGALVAETTDAYVRRIDAAKAEKRARLAALDDQRVKMAQHFDRYEYALDRELKVLTVEIARVLKAQRLEAPIEQVVEVLRGSERARWRELLAALERDKTAWHSELRRQAEALTHDQRLAELASTSPSVWREIKVAELEQRRAEDASAAVAARAGAKADEAESARRAAARAMAVRELVAARVDAMGDRMDDEHVPGVGALARAPRESAPPRTGPALQPHQHQYDQGESMPREQDHEPCEPYSYYSEPGDAPSAAVSVGRHASRARERGRTSASSTALVAATPGPATGLATGPATGPRSPLEARTQEKKSRMCVVQ